MVRVSPGTREVCVYESPEKYVNRSLHQTLDGGDVLSGLQLPLASLFAQPGETV